MEIKKDSTQIYDGKIIKVYKDHVQCPNDRIATREVVRHHGGVGIIATIDDKIILVKQFRYPYNEDTIEIPAGKIELNEDPQNCAYRELEEETNYTPSNIKLAFTVYPTPGYCDEVLHLYECDSVSLAKNPLECDEDEFIDVMLVDIKEAYQMVLDQKINDAKTIIAIQYEYAKKSRK